MNADNAKKLHADAQQLFQEKKFQESLVLLDQLGEAFPNEPNIMYARARCLVALGRFDEAQPLCAYLRDVLGHRRGAELLEHIAARAAAPAPAFNDLVTPAPRQVAAAPVRAQRGGSNKLALVGAAVAVLAIAGAGYFFYQQRGGASDSHVAEAALLPAPDSPTYTKDVAPILNKNCVVCHRTGEAVPMSLTSYEQARPWAKSIRTMVESRKMPPWHADPSVGEWSNDRRMSDRDITTLVRWVDQGTPRGNPGDEPKPPKFTEGWKIGEPDATFVASMQTLPATLEDEYRYVLVPTGFTEDRWISAAEIRPGNINVVHHVIVFTADTASGKEDLSGSLGGFAPGAPPLMMDKGRAMKIPAGAMLVLQIHYHKEPGKVETDQTTIGVKFADYTVKKEVRFGTIGTEDFVIPPRTADYPVDATFVVKEDIHLEQLVPHMHLRGKDMKVWARFPDGTRKDLLLVPNYDFNWQIFYELAEPLSVPKGTELHAYAHFDNSDGNPFNPDPNSEVRWGEPTTAEMMYAFYMYTVDGEQLKAKDPGST